MGPAADMTTQSLDPGRLITFAQFYTFRRSWSYFSTVWKDSIKVVLEGASLGGNHRVNTVLTKCITHIFLYIFVIWVELQDGNKSKPDQEIIIEVMKLLMKKM